MDPTGTLVGTSPSMQRLFASVLQVGPLDISVLLLGETGTGKSAIAQLIHTMSPRKLGPFIDFNCAELNENLGESQLFGHARGAFTGAHQQTSGIVEQGHGGTVFLDEVGELPLSQQSKLLKALDSRRVRPMGSDRTVEVDFRLLAATNRNLKTDIAEGRFRQDLFYRLAGMTMHVPPLRDRLSDMAELATWLTHRAAKRLRKASVTGISQEAIDKLRPHAWPGNVRELDNVIRRAVGMTKNTIIQPCDITFLYLGDEEPAPAPSHAPRPRAGNGKNLRAFNAEQQEQLGAFYRDVFDEADGCITRAAELAGISRNWMARMVKRHNLKG